MQLQHQAEEVLTHGVALIGAGVRVDIAHLATSLARRRGEEHAGGAVTVDPDPQHRDLLALRGLDLAHQLGRWQHAAVEFFDLEYRRVERVQQFVLKRHHCTGNAHQGQHQTGGYPEKPVQLKQCFLEHNDRLACSIECLLYVETESDPACTQKPRPWDGRGLV